MKQWKDKNVLITGCNGIIGSWLTARLIREGARVTGIIRDHVGNSKLIRDETLRQMNIAHGDITDFPFVNRVLAEYEIDTVFHLAAQTIVTIANRSPLSTFESNIKGTWVLLEACRLSPTVERVVVASSDKAYGDSEQLPYLEKYPLRGKYPYDVSKSCTDLIAQSYFHTYGLPLTITRLANVYGGGDLNFNRIIPGSIKAVLEDRSPVIRSNGCPLREYLYVEDAVEAYLVLATKLHEKEVMGQAFNFAPEHPYTVREIVNEVIRISGKDLQPEVRGSHRMTGEITNQQLDSSKARKILGWDARWRLEQGLQRTLEWYRDYFLEIVGNRK